MPRKGVIRCKKCHRNMLRDSYHSHILNKHNEKNVGFIIISSDNNLQDYSIFSVPVEKPHKHLTNIEYKNMPRKGVICCKKCNRNMLWGSYHSHILNKHNKEDVGYIVISRGNNIRNFPKYNDLVENDDEYNEYDDEYDDNKYDDEYDDNKYDDEYDDEHDTTPWSSRKWKCNICGKLDILGNREKHIKNNHSDELINNKIEVKNNHPNELINKAVQVKTDEKNNTNPQYFYIIQEREFFRSSEPTYKIGKTQQDPPFNRLKQYPKGSKTILLLGVDDCSRFETKVIKLFNNKYEKMTSYGNEYFKGDINSMINDIMALRMIDC